MKHPTASCSVSAYKQTFSNFRCEERSLETISNQQQIASLRSQ